MKTVNTEEHRVADKNSETTSVVSDCDQRFYSGKGYCKALWVTTPF